MRDYTLTHLTDAKLLRELTALASQDRETTAILLAHMAEVDARRAYVPEGYSSMFSYCVECLRLSEDAAAKRIQAARAARRVPVLFAALATGKLHLSAVWLLAPHVTPENAEELIEAATHRRKSEIEVFLARRFPAFGPSPVTRITPVAPAPRDGANLFDEHAPGHTMPKRIRTNMPQGMFASTTTAWCLHRTLTRHRSAISSKSRSHGSRTRSFAMPRRCSAMPFHPEMWPSCSTVRSML